MIYKLLKRLYFSKHTTDTHVPIAYPVCVPEVEPHTVFASPVTHELNTQSTYSSRGGTHVRRVQPHVEYVPHLILGDGDCRHAFVYRYSDC